MALNPEFAANPDPRCACVLLLDTSSSMDGLPIAAMNQGLQTFQTDIREDPLARRRVEIAVVTFGGSVQRVQDFVPAGAFTAPTLEANGGTPMGQALSVALQMVESRKAAYKANGVPYYRPWILLVTDGEPTDEWQSAAQMAQDKMKANAVMLFAVGVENANMEILESFTPRTVKLEGLRFKELFLWLSQSQKRVSGSKPGGQTPLSPITFASPV